MDIENIIVDIQLINAYEGKRDRKWKDPKLPYISTLGDFRVELESSKGWNFETLVEMPLARTLIFDYAFTTEAYKNHIFFFRDLDEAEKLVGRDAEAMVKSIQELYLPKNGQKHLPVLSGATTSASKYNAVYEIFDSCVQLLSKDLAGCWVGFVESNYYWRLIQWYKLQAEPVTENAFHLYRVLGKGGFGEVFACMKKDTGHMYAVKCQNKKRLKKKHCVPYAWKERDVLLSIKSEFVVNLKYAFETKDDLCMVMDLMKGGDLSFVLKSVKGKFEPEEARFLAAQLAIGIGDLHAVGIVYRDMKPENILVDEKGNLRISDLGLATVLGKNMLKKSKAGTPGYWAPEVLAGTGYDHTVDWWGLGIVIFEMLTGHCPFRRSKEVSREESMLQVIEYPESMPADAVEICRALLQSDYKKRLGYKHGFKAVKEHPFFKDTDWYRMSRKTLQAPYIPPAWVNAKDIHDIARFDSVKDVKLDENDVVKFGEFPLVVEHYWQKEILGTVFNRVNSFDHEKVPNDLKIDELPPTKSSTGFFRRVFGRPWRNGNKEKITEKKKDEKKKDEKKKDEKNGTHNK